MSTSCTTMASKKRASPCSRDDSLSAPPVRLLLHAVDGVIPFLTPALLEKYAPPSEHLWIGVAVRDSCVAPIFQSDLDDGSNKTSMSEIKKKNKKKPCFDPTKTCGYTFNSKKVDGVLQDYHRVLVPSFDLYQDVLDHSRRGEATVTSANHHILVWTVYGRHPLSSTLFRSIATDASASHQATVALYDTALDDDSNRRKEAANQRTIAWLDDMIESKGTSEVWAPVVLTGSQADNNRVFNHVCQSLDKVAGLALVGWHHISSREERNARLQELVGKLRKEDSQPALAMLSTRSTPQILDAARNGVSVMGTALPQIWAKSKMACVCDVACWKASKSKRAQLESGALSLDSDGCVDLGDTRWERDSRPLLEGCTCLACTDNKHSRAYLHHLVKAKELLAEILLFGHNLHHLLVLCRELSVGGNVGAICQHVESQLKQDLL